jgi:tRNA-splicing ligase RtcB (3'-phosphate/5'-hydroxy nucleic acid ligase)
MRIHSFGAADDASAAQLRRCLGVSGDEARGVLCADHHKGYSMPIGGVVASQSVILPAGVGYDIGCGNCAARTTLRAADVAADLPRIMDEVWGSISFGIGRRNDERADDPVLDAIAHSAIRPVQKLTHLAASQLGTVGSGNHYVDLFEDRGDGQLWVGVHFGSRGFGHKTACGFLALAAGKHWDERVDDSMDAVPKTIPIASALGADYLAAMALAGQYASAGRAWVVAKLLRILGAAATDTIHNHHNYAWWEEHRGERWLVVRKGATPAFPGQRGFVGGSMGDDAVILEGIDSPQSRQAFYSTVHGAGRVMGRMQAKGKWKGGRCVQAGLIDWPAASAAVRGQGVELRGAGADEAPGCYKRLAEVLAAHEGTVRVLHTLRPIGVAMAGHETLDPYKD